MLLAMPASTSARCNCTDYVTLGNITEQGTIEVNNIKLKFPVKCLTIRIIKKQEEWLIIYQIAVDIWKDKKAESLTTMEPTSAKGQTYTPSVNVS